MEVKSVAIINDEFMKQFKYYKSNKPKPSLDEVLSTDKHCEEVHKSPLRDDVLEDPRTDFLGLNTLKEWQLYTFPKHPGVLFIKNPFTDSGQRYWIRKCLEKYPRKPNRLNIDIESNIQDWWKECFQNGTCDKLLQKKLRWTTLGYHHNWDTKVYSENNRTQFPEDLAELSDVVAKYIGYENFRAEAAIVNYYHMNSTLSAHTDHSEVNLDAPLLSFSFGQSAIFLIGGKDKSIKPTAIHINSGDIIIMSREARLCYHAVPKILPSLHFPWEITNIRYTDNIDTYKCNLKYISQPNEITSLMNRNVDNEEWHRFENYIKESRINMNVRQVLN